MKSSLLGVEEALVGGGSTATVELESLRGVVHCVLFYSFLWWFHNALYGFVWHTLLDRKLDDAVIETFTVDVEPRPNNNFCWAAWVPKKFLSCKVWNLNARWGRVDIELSFVPWRAFLSHKTLPFERSQFNSYLRLIKRIVAEFFTSFADNRPFHTNFSFVVVHKSVFQRLPQFKTDLIEQEMSACLLTSGKRLYLLLKKLLRHNFTGIH